MSPNANKKWSEEERNYLADVWGVLSVNRIAKELGRSPEAVISQAEKRQLGGAIYTDQYLTTITVSNLIGVDQTTIINWIKKKLLKARTSTLRRRRIYLIDPSDVTAFLKNNPTRWNATKIDKSLVDESEEWFRKKYASDLNPTATKRGNLWTTKEENNLLRYVIKGYTNEEIAKLLDRTPLSVKRKRNRIGERLKHMKVILICGQAHSGKTTLAKFLKEHLDINNRGVYCERTLIRNNGQSVKDIAVRDFKWNGVKDESGRQLLLDITEDGYAQDQFYWERETFHEAIKHKEYHNKNCDVLIIPDWRYPSTKSYFDKMADEVITIKITRDEADGTHKDHPSENIFKNFIVNFNVTNNCDLKYLRGEARRIVRRCNY